MMPRSRVGSAMAEGAPLQRCPGCQADVRWFDARVQCTAEDCTWFVLFQTRNCDGPVSLSDDERLRAAARLQKASTGDLIVLD